MEPKIHTFHEPVTGTWQYIVADPLTREAVIVDSVLDYNKDNGSMSTESPDKLLEVILANGYTVMRILETHAHADHLTASRYLQHALSQLQDSRSPLVCIGKGITQVQETMGQIYDIPASEMENAFDYTFSDGERLVVGNIESEVIHLPGHTPDHVGYIIGSNVFTGDSIFNPDIGSARCDFPGGSAAALYKSMQKLLALPDYYKLYTGHDYPPKDRKIAENSTAGAVPFTTVKEQKEHNKHVKSGTSMEEFVAMRTDRDSTLSAPKLMLQSMHVNVRGGRLPARPMEEFKPDQDLSSILAAA